MTSNMTPEMVATIYGHTILAVSFLLAGGGVGFAIGSGVVCGDTMGCLVRQPETRPGLLLDTFIFTGLVGNFPFIILAFGAWFLFANPFIDTLKSALSLNADQLVTTHAVAPSTKPATIHPVKQVKVVPAAAKPAPSAMSAPVAMAAIVANKTQPVTAAVVAHPVVTTAVTVKPVSVIKVAP